MITKVYNIQDSYDEYRKDAIRLRLSNAGLRTDYTRLPIKLLEREETKKSITPEPEITEKDYLKIVAGYLKFLVRKVLEGHKVRMGAKLGIIFVKGAKLKPVVKEDGTIKGLYPSWAKTKIKWTDEATALGMTFKEYVEKVPREDRKLVYCFNEHSDYTKYTIVWAKKKVIYKNKIYYSLTFNRVVKRTLWKLIVEGKEYIVSQKS